MRRLNVALWAEALVGGYTGTRTFLENIVSCWLKDHADEITVTLVLPASASTGDLRLNLPAGPLRTVEFAGGKWPLRLSWLFGRQSLRDQIGDHDIFLSGWFWPLGAKDTPFVGIVHDLRPLAAGWGKRFSPRDAAWRFLYRSAANACISRAAAIVTPSAFTLWHMKTLGFAPEQPTRVIAHGVDPARWACPAGDVPAALDRLGIGRNTNYVLAIGQHVPNKNLHRLLEAFHRGVSADDASARLVIAGGFNSESDRLRATIDEHALGDRVVLLGRVADDDLTALMRGARIFAFVSLFEGFGIPVLEAFAAGVPVLTSKTTSLGEVAADAALTVDPADTDAIAAALRRLWFDPALRQALVARGSERARQFRWEAAAKEFVELFRDVAGAGA